MLAPVGPSAAAPEAGRELRKSKRSRRRDRCLEVVLAEVQVTGGEVLVSDPAGPEEGS